MLKEEPVGLIAHFIVWPLILLGLCVAFDLILRKRLKLKFSATGFYFSCLVWAIEKVADLVSGLIKVIIKRRKANKKKKKKK